MGKNIIMLLGAAGVIFTVYLVLSAQPNLAPDRTQETATEQMEGVVSVELNEQNDSGEMGMATLTEVEGEVVVSLSTQGYAEDISQPAHIHLGSCPDVGAVEYPLTNVVNGESETTLEGVSMDDLESGLPLAINVHKSVPEVSVYTACGDLEL